MVIETRPGDPGSRKERAKFLAKLTIKLHTNCIKYLVGPADAQTNSKGQVNLPGPINKQQIFYANFQFNTALNARTPASGRLLQRSMQIPLAGQTTPVRPCAKCVWLKRPINRMRFHGTLQHFVVIFIIYTDTEWAAHLCVIGLRGIPGGRGPCYNIELEIIGRNLFVCWSGTW